MCIIYKGVDVNIFRVQGFDYFDFEKLGRNTKEWKKCHSFCEPHEIAAIF